MSAYDCESSNSNQSGSGWMITLLAGTALLAAALFSRSPYATQAAGPAREKAATYVGQVVPLGGGTIRSWVRTDNEGNPSAIGVTFTEAAMHNLPQPTPGVVETPCCSGPEYALKLPTELSVAPFTHIVVNWNPRGHEPMAMYGVPHFDFHFYTISSEDREAIKIDPENLAKVTAAPPAGAIPTGYMQAPGGVPKMGAHWVDTAAPELNGKPFDKTFLYGSHNARVAFIEPMITKAYLESHPDVMEPVKQPKLFPVTGGYWPTAYTVRYDADAKEYTVALESLARR